MNITFNMTSNGTGIASDFFGVLNVSTTLENVTSNGKFTTK